MKTIELSQQHPTVEELLAMAANETLLIRSLGGGEFVLGSADDLGDEASILGRSPEFMSLIEERRKEPGSIPLSEIKARLQKGA